MLKNDEVSGVSGVSGVRGVSGYSGSSGWITGPKGLTGGCPVGPQGVAGTSGWIIVCENENCSDTAKTYVIENKEYNFCMEHKIEFDKNMRKQKLQKINNKK